ncbi:helix-turn-helix transcriptional regulator [Mycobacterium sp. M26]|uniref:helix-turn-helix domain-containing protein n=1 Tax=Mycobacterium sp. M26 TaxID=1762962 RepID=UPI0009E8E4D7|nr:helix-turn-helix transcriptional regulator [Mycobacterium sp. M26]
MSESSIERDVAETLGRRLAELRQARGLTQETVAQAAGISRNHYQLLECGIGQRGERKPANPRLSTLIALSEVLGITVPELIEGMFNQSDSALDQLDSTRARETKRRLGRTAAEAAALTTPENEG